MEKLRKKLKKSKHDEPPEKKHKEKQRGEDLEGEKDSREIENRIEQETSKL